MTASQPALIDIHSHFVPHGFPSAPDEESARRWPCMCHNPDGKALLKVGDKPFRKLDARSWGMSRRLDDMDRDGVTMQVLSPMPELLSYWFDPAVTTQLAHHINGAIAHVCAERPDRFGGLGMVPMQDVDAAVAMLPRIKADGLVGIEIGSNVNGRYLGEEDFEPVFAAAAQLGLAVFIHALHPLVAPQIKSWPEMVPFAGFITDTGLSAASLIMSGVMERHPTLRIGLSHGGGTLLPIVSRLQKGFESTAGFSGSLTISPREIASRFFLDSLVYDTGLAIHLAKLSPGRICLGTDYPYLIEQQQPREFIAAVATGEGDAIWNGAARLFMHGPAAG